MLQFTGTLKVKNDEIVVSDKFKKREFVLSDDHDQYPQVISFQLSQDKTSLIDNVNLGDTITVNFNLRGREWTNKEGKVMYFNTLDAWKIELQSSTQRGGRNEQTETPSAATVQDLQEEEDLPF